MDRAQIGEMSLDEKKHLLIEGLEAGYRARCDAVQAIPYLRNPHSVQQVSVESDIRFFKKGRGNSSSWERLESYKRVFEDHRVRSVRIIVQADSGYGKTFLSLRFAHDWYTRDKSSPLSDIEILIVLQLRLLGRTTSIYRAIRKFLLPKGSKIRVRDIEQILRNCKSVLVILDGYDEYNFQKEVLSDVNQVIVRDLFQEFEVLLTGRYLPREFDKSVTSILGLYGFDEKARDEYIKKAIVGDDIKELRRIKQQLTMNPILEDLCQVPLLFAAFAHMTHQHEMKGNVDTVRKFFSEVIKCFHEHLEIKTGHSNVEEMSLAAGMDTDTKFNELAFEVLTNGGGAIAMEKREMCRRLDENCYGHFIRIGILIEEEVMDSIGVDDGDDDTNIQTTTKSRFFHKLFCEWYASFHFSKLASGCDEQELKAIMDKLNPIEFQYFYRFACGRTKAGKRIIEQLVNSEAGIQILPLCILEKPGPMEDVAPAIENLFADLVVIAEHDNRLLQRSKINLLEIAGNLKIPITFLRLSGTFKSVNDDGDRPTIILQSGLSLSPLVTLEGMTIVTEEGNVLDEDGFDRILKYTEKCRDLRVIRFQCCELPEFIPPSEVLSLLRSRDVKIAWTECAHILNLEYGEWQLDEFPAIRESCEAGVGIYNDWSEHAQGLQMKLLDAASRNDIPVDLWLREAYWDIDSTTFDVVLQSGLSLPRLRTAGLIHIETEEGQQITQDEMMGILNYATHSRSLRQLRFNRCELPSSIPKEGILSVLKSRGVEVIWLNCGHSLNLHSGKWQMGDMKVIGEACSHGVSIHEHWSKDTHRLLMELLEVASSHSMPIEVWLKQSFSKIDPTSNDIILNSGLPLPRVASAELIVVETEEMRSIIETEMMGILDYATHSERLRELCFSCCDMPPSVPVGNELSTLKSIGAKVAWLDCGHCLNHQSGQWEMDDMEAIRESCRVGVTIYRQWSTHTQKLQISLLERASENDIPIEFVALGGLFCKVDMETESLVLNSGVSIPHLSSLKSLSINERGRVVTTEELECLFHFSKHFDGLDFYGCLLPYIVPLHSTSETFVSGKLQVLWGADGDHVYNLNPLTGRWNDASNLEEMTRREYSEILAGSPKKWGKSSDNADGDADTVPSQSEGDVDDLPSQNIPDDSVDEEQDPTDTHSDMVSRRAQSIQVTRGFFHQASLNIFTHDAVGTQCSSISLMAVVVASLKPHTSWTSMDLDNILLQGDRAHIKVLRSLGWPITRSNGMLDIDELPSTLTVDLDGIPRRVGVSVMNGNIYCLSKDFKQAMLSALEEKPGHFILRMFDKCTAILHCRETRKCSIFDPHSSDTDGAGVADGAACLIHFGTSEGMVSYLESRLSGEARVQVDITPVEITVLGDDIADDGSDVSGSRNTNMRHDEIDSKVEAHPTDESENVHKDGRDGGYSNQCSRVSK